MNKNDLMTALKAAGLERLEKDVDKLARWSIRMVTTAVDESKLPGGSSKIGGMPDLPATISWPEWKGLPQSFIAQLRLEDLHPYDSDNLLPDHGMLWFFYDAKQQVYGEDPKDAGGWHVFYQETPTALQRASAPAKLPAKARFHACSIAFASEITLSQQPTIDIPNCDWSDDEQQRYETFLSTFPTADDHAQIHNRVLGNPDTIQDDMREQCQLVSNGVTDEDDPRAKKLAAGAMDWNLLLQVDSDEHAGMQWASTGMLYYWIKKADLAARHFDANWLVLQSE